MTIGAIVSGPRDGVGGFCLRRCVSQRMLAPFSSAGPQRRPPDDPSSWFHPASSQREGGEALARCPATTTTTMTMTTATRKICLHNEVNGDKSRRRRRRELCFGFLRRLDGFFVCKLFRGVEAFEGLPRGASARPASEVDMVIMVTLLLLVTPPILQKKKNVS